MSNIIRCLMIGQSGIGKSTFLKEFPNSKTHVNTFADRENVSIECLNQSLDAINIEIENCDIALETCLHDSELIVNNKVIPSSKIINTCVHKVIILCFAMDDPGSFELIKSKWEVDLKKNKKNKHSFVLLGLKSDKICSKKGKKNENNTEENHTSSESLRMKYKKRSYSIESNSSTSKLHSQTRPIADSFVTEEETTSLKPNSYYKKFAKTIGANSFVKVSNNQDEKSFEKLVSYDKFIQSICKPNKKSLESNSIPNSESMIAGPNEETLKKIGFKNRIPKSFSAPLRLIKNRKQKNLTTLNESNCMESGEFSCNGNANDMSYSTTNSNDLEQKKLKKNEQYENLEQIESSFSIKEKLSRFVIDIGTYVVTCGGSNSRKLVHLRPGKNEFGAKFSKYSSNNRSFRRKKSLLLVSSELSLNTLNNEATLY